MTRSIRWSGAAGMVLVVLAGIVGLVGGGEAARGDGGYVPEMGYPMMPQIPVQRAIVVQWDGAWARVLGA